MERSTIFKNGKPSISMGHFPWLCDKWPEGKFHETTATCYQILLQRLWTHTEIYPIRKWNHLSYWMKYELFGYGSKAWYPGNCPGDTSAARRQRPRSLEAAGGSPKLHLGTDVETGDVGRNWCALEASSKEVTPSFRQCSEKCDFTIPYIGLWKRATWITPAELFVLQGFWGWQHRWEQATPMGVIGKSDKPQKIRQNTRHNQGKPGRWQGYKKAFEVSDNPSSLFRANHVTVNSYCWFKSPLNIASKPQWQWFRHGGTWGLGGVIRTQRLSGWKRRHCGGGGRKLMETSVRRGLGVRRKSEWFQI